MVSATPQKVVRVYYLTPRGVMFQKLVEGGMDYDDAMNVVEALS